MLKKENRIQLVYTIITVKYILQNNRTFAVVNSSKYKTMQLHSLFNINDHRAKAIFNTDFKGGLKVA